MGKSSRKRRRGRQSPEQLVSAAKAVAIAFGAEGVE